MAYASVLSLSQTIYQILQSQSQFHDEEQQILQSDDKDRLFLRPEEQLRTLNAKLRYLLSFLENSSPSNRKIVSSVERRIRDAAYEAEDLIELHFTIPMESPMTERISHTGVASAFQELIDVLQFIFGWTGQTFDEKLQKVIQKFNSIYEEVVKKKKRKNNIWALNSISDHVFNFGSRGKSTSMVGFKDDMRQIKELLRGKSPKLETITIVGMGGIGKTTLARNIHNDSSVNDHFDKQAWTTASQEYNLAALLADLLKSMGEPTHGKDIGDLKEKLYQKLKQRRYLIIIDDVWNANIAQEFGRALPNDSNGSRIIMTSRSSYNLAGFNNSCNHIHRLNFLSPRESWILLQQKTFGGENCPLELEDIGRRIAENCKGLALALVTVGGILRNAKRQSHWEYVAEDMKSAKTGSYENLMEILSWSYTQLPHHLRACFLFMGVFPEDFAVRVSHLIMLWVANGFIKPAAHKTLEDVAKEYLEALIDRNLVVVHERYASGEIKTCVVHDLIRDLCIEKANDEKFLVVVHNGMKISPGVFNKCRHLAITDESMRLRDFEDVYDSTLRSILCLGGQLRNMHFQLLKVFDALKTKFDKFPIELLQLANLKYIALVCSNTSEIPSLISELRHLQTLLVFISSYDVKIILPSEILNMPQLRHLWVQGGILHHASDGRNENLQTIGGVRNFIITENGIGIFPNLKRLGVTYDENEWGSSGVENLVRLCQLEFLKLGIHDSFLKLPLGEDLSFPMRLKELSLRGFRLAQEQMSMIGSLPNLEVLKLKYVEFDEEEGWKTNEDEFPELKFLLLQRPNKFSWDLEGATFPSLECLTLDGMYDQDRLPSEVGEIQNLIVINLYKCASSVVDSAYKIRDEQRNYRDDIQIQVYSGDVYKRKFKDYMLYGR